MAAALQLDCREELDAAAQAEWAAFHATAAHQHPHQTPASAAAEEAIGRKALYVTGRGPDGSIKATGLFTLQPHGLLKGAWSDAYCLSGPVCDDTEELADFLDGVARLPAFRKVGRLRVTPYWTNEDAKHMQQVLAARRWRPTEIDTFRQTGWIDLTRPSEAIFASFSKSARRQMRRAESFGIEVRPLSDEYEARLFHDSVNRLYQRRGLKPVSLEASLADFRSLDPERKARIILGAFHNGDFVAGLQLFACRIRAHSGHFTTEPERLHEIGNLRIAPFLWSHGIQWARDLGCRKLDVEGWKADADKNDAHYNIYKYKSEFAPEPVLRIGEHSRTVNPLVDLVSAPRKKLLLHARRLRRRFR